MSRMKCTSPTKARRDAIHRDLSRDLAKAIAIAIAIAVSHRTSAIVSHRNAALQNPPKDARTCACFTWQETETETAIVIDREHFEYQLGAASAMLTRRMLEMIEIEVDSDKKWKST